MCGICGEVVFRGGPVDPVALARMGEALAARGPDGEGNWQGQSVALGHRRLAIIDPLPRSDQPMVDDDLALVFNGAIYNHAELRHELEARGHRFRTAGDTEVVLAAYRAWGDACVQRLHGMFAFAVWDSGRRRLFAARDRLGVKPFYFTHDSARLRFASTPQALLAGGGVDTALDPVALRFVFTLHGVVPAPRTLLRGIAKLAPAHCLAVDAAGRLKTWRYWDLPSPDAAGSRSPAEWAEALHPLLRDAVRCRHAVADVPVGLLLSGGLDSSLLLALLAEAGVADLRTFSIGFADQPEEAGDEFAYSDRVARAFGARHRRFRIDDDEVLARLPQVIDAMAEPMFGQDAVAFHLLAEQVARDVRVVLAGQGADEVFGGYACHARIAAAHGGSRLERFRRVYFDREDAEYRALVSPDLQAPDHVSDQVAAALDAPGAGSLADAMLAFDVGVLMVDDPVKRVDNMTMAFGLEARLPYLDHRVVELAASCPAAIRLADGGKGPLRRIARGRLPDAVIHRPKGYFPVPSLKYVRRGVLDFVRDVLGSEACRRRGLFRGDHVSRLLVAPDMQHTRLMQSKVWQLAVTEAWLQQHVDPVRSRPR